jgi:hypothetical protein
MGTGREARLRVGTTDRERAVEALGVHLAEGRIGVQEYSNRCGAAAAAVTRADLLDLFYDLPSPHPTFGTPPSTVVARTEREDNPLLERANPERTRKIVLGFVGAAAVGVVVVAAVTSTWWALAPILIIGFLFLLAS